MLIALVSAKGAPGVTTASLAMALTWPRHVLLAECDPRGGDVLAGFAAARVPAGRGLLELQVRGRNGSLHRELWGQLVRLPDASNRHFLLPGLDSPQQAGAVDWVQMAALFRQIGDDDVDVLADCGQVHTQHAPMPVLRAADLVVLVTRATLPSVHKALRTAELVREDLGRNGLGADRLVSLVISAPRGYSEREISQQFAGLGMQVVGILPWHERTARVLSDGTDSSDRYLHSPLIKAAASVAHTVGAQALANRGEEQAMRTAAAPPGQINGHAVAMTGMGRGERHV